MAATIQFFLPPTGGKSLLGRSGGVGASMTDWDAVVVGAGAAGLMTAIHAAERGRRVLLLEKGRKPGVKILMSGGTRCNITHDCDNRGIIEAFGPNGKFLHSALAAFGVRDAIAFFEGEGVATKVEDTGKIFPVSDRALDVLNALLRRLERSGATLATSEPVREIVARPEGGFHLTTAVREVTTPHVVVTTGGRSYPAAARRATATPSPPSSATRSYRPGPRWCH
ncbi:NAD(FAD)-utilizing dehydrogenase [Fimbriiglobus ruber]|uniref:NAD(FAD)-utilizing dehydrogenase n=1 Tax=Fimbriiglobus ruber TaxID=1908690 RepID=A0A225E1J6_9BACT|nr:NAD(FAD)-utilizing dehydrogenase [Fimbriiglobus ruber]